MKKKVLILTLNDYILYQPSILNLYDALDPHFEVEVISFLPHGAKAKETSRTVTYLQTKPLAAQWYEKKDFILSRFTPFIRKIKPEYTYYYSYYNYYLPSVLRQHLKKRRTAADIVIAVDLQVLHLAQQLFGSVHFLSLEIDNNTNPFYRRIDFNKIKSVFIQSKQRYEYMFPGQNLNVFYIQNAPSYNGQRYPVTGRKDFIWAGAIDKRLAIIETLNFFRAYPQHHMVLKGSANPKMLAHIETEYKDLINKSIVEFNRTYLESGSFISFLAQFRIGFCFYEWDLIRASFNYLTAPSGKLFMNFAAGVPAIACNIPGFKLIEEFGAGVLVDNYEPATIEAAVQKIEADFEKYSEGCYRAAEYFSFDRNVAPYINFLLKTEA
ncbi:MAG: hypothetical protein QM781_06225 [Chitinophagaceae bacterium]